MKEGDIVKIKTYGGRYRKGKITKISDAYTHVYKYSEPVAYRRFQFQSGKCVKFERRRRWCVG